MAMEKDRKKEVLKLLRVVKKTSTAALRNEESRGGAEEGRCLVALSTLKPLPAASSGVRRSLMVLRKHPNTNIQHNVHDVLNTRKRVRVFRGPANHDNNAAKERKSIRVRISRPKEVSSARVHGKKTDSLNKSDCEKASFVKIDQDLPGNNNAFRDKVKGLLYKGLLGIYDGNGQQDVKERTNASNPLEVATSLESALFEKWGHTTGPSSRKYRSVLFNIKHPENPDFRSKLFLGVIKEESIANMSQEEMASDERQREYQHIKANKKGTTDGF